MLLVGVSILFLVAIVTSARGAASLLKVSVDIREIQLLGTNGSAEVSVLFDNKTNDFVRVRSYITVLRGGKRVTVDFLPLRTFALRYDRGRPFWGRELVPGQKRPDGFTFKFPDAGPRRICVAIDVSRRDADTGAKLPNSRGSDCFLVK